MVSRRGSLPSFAGAVALGLTAALIVLRPDALRVDAVATVYRYLHPERGLSVPLLAKCIVA